MKKLKLAALSLLVSSTLLAEMKMTLDGMVGRRWTNIGDNGHQANEYALSGQYQVKDLPLSFGGLFSLVDFRNEDFEGMLKITDTAYLYELSMELKAWLPQSFTQSATTTPYIKFAQVLISEYELKGKAHNNNTYTSLGESAGYQINLGFNYKYSKKLEMLGEYSMATKSLKQKSKFKTRGARAQTSKDSFDSRALLFGAKFRI